MANYIPTDWKDEIVDGAGNVVQKGTPLSAANLKKLEAGVEGAVAGVVGKVDGVIFDQFKTATTTQLADIATINVKFFGAKGNGTKDDTQAIQNAVNALVLLGGGKLYLPKGIYVISKTITIDGVDYLDIQGTSETILSFNNTPVTGVIVQAFDIRNVKKGTIEKIRIHGNYKAFYGISLTSCSGIHLRDIYVKETVVDVPMRGDGSGIRFIYCQDCSVRDSEFYDIGGDGVLTLGSSYILIDHCHSERCLRHNYAFAEPISYYCTLKNSAGIDSYLSGIDNETGRYCTIENNHFKNNGHYQNIDTAHNSLYTGISMMGSSYSNKVLNNIIDNPKSYGIWCVQPTDFARTVGGVVEAVSDITSGNIIRKSGSHGIFISGSVNQANDNLAYIVSDNIIEKSEGNGINCGYKTTGATIKGNHIYNAAGIGININTAEKLIIEGNLIDKSGVTGIHAINLSSSIISGNVINLESVVVRFINIDNGSGSISNLIVANNVTNADSVNSQKMVRLYANAGYKSVSISGNTGKGNINGLIEIRIGEPYVSSDCQIFHSNYMFDINLKAWTMISRPNHSTSIATLPSFVAQTAVVNGVIYIATGVASTADWKQVTN